MSRAPRRCSRFFCRTTIAVGIAGPLAAAAQTPTVGDSLPTRGGTYALEGGVGVSSTSVGLLRFLSPRSALGLTLTGSVTHQTSGSSNTSNSDDNGGFALNLGYRRYGRLHDRLAAFGTVGVTGGYSHYRTESTGETSQGTYTNVNTSSYGTAGGFGEVGATYLVLPRLAVNASALASVVGIFGRSSNEQTGAMVPYYDRGARTRGVAASIGPVRVGLTLFL